MRSISAAAEFDGAGMTSPEIIFYDGITARRRVVSIALETHELVIVENDTIVARWPYTTLREQDAPHGGLRLAASAAPELARLDINDPNLAAEILRRSPTIPHMQRTGSVAKAQIVGWSLTAAVSLVLTAIYLLPLAADSLTPLIPHALEDRLGEMADNHVRVIFGGETCAATEGSAALAKMQASLMAGVAGDLTIQLSVLSSPIANAFALPGGRIYLFNGLIASAVSAEEVAGVLAHEIGHVVHRDGLRRLIQSSGSSFLIGLLFGDVLGAGTLIMAGETLINSSYSRDQERAADAFAADIFLAIGQSPKPLGALLTRISKSEKAGIQNLRILLDHPLSEERLAALSARGEPASPAAPLLSETEWQALKNICPPAAAKSPA